LRSLLLRLLRRDNDLRLSKEVQQQYRACGDCSEAKDRVTNAVQKCVVREAGLDVTEGLDLLRSALTLAPGDQEVIDSCFYLRNNIHVPCPLPVGARVPAVSLLELHEHGSSALTLTDLASAADYTIICAGSGT